MTALETGRPSWTAILDAVRLGPADDEMAVACTPLREVIDRQITAGHWHAGDPPILIVADSGYDTARLAHDGPELRLSDEGTWPQPAHHTRTETRRYGMAQAVAFNRVHPRLTPRRLDQPPRAPAHPRGNLIRLTVDSVPSGQNPNPIRLWSSKPTSAPAQADLLWEAYLHRFDLEHTFRLFKQILGWSRPRLRYPAAADTWIWLIIAAHANCDWRATWPTTYAAPGRIPPIQPGPTD